MCTTCGCSSEARLTVTRMHGLGEDKDHGPHQHHARDAQILRLEENLLGRNDRLAELNRERFATAGIVALNLLSSPGSGKTRLLERTLTDLREELPMAVIEGDQQTLADARRIRETGVPVVQLNTGAGCHLEADMLARGLDQLDPPAGSLLFIENVGNLVCPALFDLGEEAKVVILSVTEGEDKPLKYPHMFRAADLLLINKVDLLPHLEFDLQACLTAARQVNPGLEILQLSAHSGAGLSGWYDWLRARARSRARPACDRSQAVLA